MTRVQTRQFSSENRKGFLKKEIAPIIATRGTETTEIVWYQLI